MASLQPFEQRKENYFTLQNYQHIITQHKIDVNILYEKTQT